MPVQAMCAVCGIRVMLASGPAIGLKTCPNCREPFVVLSPDVGAEDRVAANSSVGESAPMAVRSAPDALDRAEVLAAFGGRIEPVRPTLLYRIWTLIVAGVMILLPLIYVGLIGLVAYGVYYHATRDIALFQNVKSGRAAFIAYVAPLVAGVVVVVFMLKPLFARPARPPQRQGLDPDQELLLFSFIENICRTVGAPSPERIEVDCQVNASARLDNGPLAPRRRLVLTIGLPLAAGLNLKEFAGVMAHEFGHFSQSAGMRLSYLIRSINHWFARVVYERDGWDQTLADWSSQGNIYTMLVVWLARGGLADPARLVGSHVAGACRERVPRRARWSSTPIDTRPAWSGGPVFRDTMEKVGELSLASQGAYADLSSSWKEQRLPDDLPRLVLANVPKFRPGGAAVVSNDERRGGTGDFRYSTRRATRYGWRRPSRSNRAPDSSHSTGRRRVCSRTSMPCLAQPRSTITRGCWIRASSPRLHPVAEAVASTTVAQEGAAARTV